MKMGFEDRVAVVTGGASGIGAAIVRDLAGRGAKIVIADLAMDDARAIAADLPTEARCIETDVADPQSVQAMVDFALSELGGLDMAVNNAGIDSPQVPIGELDLDDWAKVIAVNLTGVMHGLRYQIPAMLERGGGRIVNMASILGQVGFANSAPYVAAKHGVVGLTRTAALEYAAKGVRVNAVGPAFINTPLVQHSLSEEQLHDLEAQHPVGRLGEPNEVAGLVAWLLGDEASFAHGTYYPVDGGYLAR